MIDLFQQSAEAVGAVVKRFVSAADAVSYVKELSGDTRAGIAATGSLLLELADPYERSATALPLIHVVFVKGSTIAPDLYALHELLAQELASAKTAYLSITTGPSRTADIERVLTIGVHGPKELHVLVLEGE